MPNFPVLSLFITLTILTAAAKQQPPENPLADQVCANTTHDHFCRQSIYSDPRAPTADRIVIAYIVFDNAYLNVTRAQAQIQDKINEIGPEGEPGILAGLKSCMGKYDRATRALAEMLGNMDSESYDGLDKLSREARNDVVDCEAGFDGTRAGSPMAKENEDLIKLTDICYVVSQLFE